MNALSVLTVQHERLLSLSHGLTGAAGEPRERPGNGTAPHSAW